MADSRRERILNFIGLGLLAVCFVVALGRIAWLRSLRGEGGTSAPVSIRFAHWQLEGGLREAYDAIAEEYMKRNPGVRVQQIAVPERMFAVWITTQLAGGTAPDIIALGGIITAEKLARYFEPLSDLVNDPNPWNAGTPLENAPLRETFLDGMEGAFNAELLEYYGLPSFAHTVRMYYNLDLLREVTGAEELPKTYDELTALAGQVEEYNRRTGRSIVPIAGSQYNSGFIMSLLYGSQTLGLGERLAYDALAGASERINPAAPQLAMAAARGDWALDEPEIRAGLGLQRDVGRHMQPGFLQANRDDAGFYFTMGGALMIPTGSWDLASLVSQSPFRIAVARIPYPQPGDPSAPFSLGPLAEGGSGLGGLFGVTRASRHPEVARDFLLFLVSQPINQRFAELSKWSPAVVGVVPNEEVAAFAPFFDGYPTGFGLTFSGADASRLVGNATHLLTGPNGSVDDFVEAIRPDYLAALAADLRRAELVVRDNSQRLDTRLGALGWLRSSDRSADTPRAEERLDTLLQAVTATDFAAARTAKAARELNRGPR
jgi:raffinose/stachyose/melibiose transport system substrate-binding protein